jgi:Anti sigma-E protein RseA, N-terminal domain
MSRDEWNEPLTPQQRIDEQVSALVDGELSLEESVLLEKRLERNANLQSRVLRYGLIGELIRNTPTPHAVDVTARVRQALVESPSVGGRLEESASAPSRWQWLSGLAVAAAVMVVTVWLVQPRFGSPSPVASNPPVAANPTEKPGVVQMAATRESDHEHVLADPLVAAHLAHHEPYSYVTPGIKPMPQAEMARYVAAHVALVTPSVEQNALMNLLADGDE